MPNHFHLLVTPLIEGGISQFMGKLATGYSMYFNKKSERTGRLFEGTFKSIHVDSDQYLKYLFSYIHLNPVKLYKSDWREEGLQDKEKAFNYVKSFYYSSLRECVGIPRKEVVILDKSKFPVNFETEQKAKQEIFDWLNYDLDLDQG